MKIGILLAFLNANISAPDNHTRPHYIQTQNDLVSYKKLWKLLIDKDMKKQDLMRLAKLNPTTLSKLNRGDNMNTDILVRICTALNCNVADIMDIYPDAE